MSAPKQPSCANPTSSSKMKMTFGAPSRARVATGQAAVDWPAVLPIVPVNADPSGYCRVSAMLLSPPAACRQFGSIPGCETRVARGLVPRPLLAPTGGEQAPALRHAASCDDRLAVEPDV